MTERKKWWELATTDQEQELFLMLTRSKYIWRKFSTICEKLKIDGDELLNMIKPYVKNGIIITNDSDFNNFYIAHYDRVISQPMSSEENNFLDIFEEIDLDSI